MNSESCALTLPKILKRLEAEKAMVCAELSAMPPDDLFNVKGSRLINREQELHVTLLVLKDLSALPQQIAEPTH